MKSIERCFRVTHQVNASSAVQVSEKLKRAVHPRQVRVPAARGCDESARAETSSAKLGLTQDEGVVGADLNATTETEEEWNLAVNERRGGSTLAKVGE